MHLKIISRHKIHIHLKFVIIIQYTVTLYLRKTNNGFTKPLSQRPYSYPIEINYILLTASGYYNTHHSGQTGLPQV
jgi:hypothetical protein